MDIKRFPEKMGDLPIDFSNPKRTLISGLFQETAKVGGQPRKFLTYIPEESAESVRNTMRSLKERDPAELDAIGARGREFVLKNKNRNVQMQRVLDFINEGRRNA